MGSKLHHQEASGAGLTQEKLNGFPKLSASGPSNCVNLLKKIPRPPNSSWTDGNNPEGSSVTVIDQHRKTSM